MSDRPPAPEAPRSVSELLQRRAAERPDQVAFVFMSESSHEGPGAQASWTYAQLDAAARSVAAAVNRAAQPGDRAVLVFPPGLEFVAAFFGCLYAGVLPVPATYPKPRRVTPRLDAIVADCTPRIGLTMAETQSNFQLEGHSPAVRNLPWIAVDKLNPADAVSAPLPRGLEDAAFLQYTSGSTSQPRGVIVTHGNLLHNLELIRRGFDLPAADNPGPAPVGVFWLPAYHDMGLIGGILSPLYVGGTTHLFAPAAFLQRPFTWLETLSRTGAQISGAPNFAYDLCARKITPEQRASLDLSKWRVAFCGAEPIDAGVLDSFSKAFAPAGFRTEAYFPCYGLAEATLLVSGGAEAGRPRVLHADRARLAAHQLVDAGPHAAAAQPLVSCGQPLGDQDVRIVNPQSFEPLGEGAVGEVWVRGDSVASGYWNHPEELWQTFGGRLADGSGPYLRTGDLGGMLDGELFVSGRLKDVIIIRGRNLYPQDIERTAREAHEAVDQGAAFAIHKDGVEQLVVVHQVEREHRRGDLTPVLRAIRSAIVDEHDVDPAAILLLRPGTLPLTSSGKVQRSRCREMFAANGFDELARWSPPVEAASQGAPRAGETARVNGAMPLASPPRPKFLDRIAGYSPEALTAEIQAWMLAWLADRVGHDAVELTPTAPFTELGMDSLTAVELNVEFENVLGVRLPSAAAWSYPTPAALSEYIAQILRAAASGGGPGGSNPVDSWFQAMDADTSL